MYYSSAGGLNTSQSTIEEFLGYNHNRRISYNEFYDMENMTGEYYPLAATRKRRGYVKKLTNPQGLINRGKLCYVDGNDFYINGEAVPGLILSTLPDDCPKQLVSMGSYVCIFPDKKYVNTEDMSDYGGMEAEYAASDSTSVTYIPCKINGEEINPAISDNPPSDPDNGTYWLDTSGDDHILWVWSSPTEMWVSVATSYVKISAGGIGVPFEEDDAVTISGSGVEDIEGDFVVYDKGDNYIVIGGLIDQSKTVQGGLKVARRVPLMDFVVECNNRLWGCHYGPTEDGVVNEIYSSKLGDFKNWRYFSGTSIDSYTASLGSDGAFTGAVSYQNTVVFFKEFYIHHVYGSLPENFSITSFSCNGVQKGCSESVRVVDGDVIYKGTDGFYGYNGQLPGSISYNLGEETFYEAKAGVLDGRYYTAVKNAKGENKLFVYNRRTGLWHKEDNLIVKWFCTVGNELYIVDGDNNLIAVTGSEGELERPVNWMIELPDIGYSTPDKNYVEKVYIRLEMERDTFARIFIQYDKNGNWEHVDDINDGNLKSVEIPITPRRCEFFRFKLTGKGDCKVYSIIINNKKGSAK